MLGSSLCNGIDCLVKPQNLQLTAVFPSARQLQAPVPDKVAKENAPRQSQISDLFASVSPDLQDTNAWRYQRQISGGVQEYMEAVSFQHYVETQRLITYEEAQAKISGGVSLTEDDYILGLFDLVGELMRFAITGMATNGVLPRGAAKIVENGDQDILTDLRSLRTAFETLNTTHSAQDRSPLKRDLEKKMEVMKTCVEKVENAVYGMIIRGRERPKGWVPDMASGDRGREPVESF